MPYSILYLHNREKIAGAEKSLLALVRRLDRQSFIPSFILSSDGEFAQALRAEKVPLSICPFAPLRSIRADRILASLRALEKIVVRVKPHLLHGNTPRTNLYAGWLGRRRGIPVVWHARNLIYGMMLDIEKLLSFLPDRIICNSEAIRDRFRGQNGFEKRVLTVHSGIDLSEFRPEIDGTPIRREFGGGIAWVALVGRIGLGKGHEIFLRASQKVVAQFSNARFLIVGRAEDEDDARREIFLKRLAGRLGLQSQVIFTGYRQDMPRLMAAIDLLVVATEAEPFGRVILEAMAAGKPVVGTSSGGTPELVEHEKTGLLVPPRDSEAMAKAILRLLKNLDEARHFGANGRKRVEAHFSVEAHVRHVEALYHSLLK